ncbi:unnamed protein product, partial [Candidula unifasciata]
CRTEREFPPIIMGPDFKCKNFVYTGQYFHLHGGINFDLESDPPSEPSPELTAQYRQLVDLARKQLQAHVDHADHNIKEHYSIPVYTVAGKMYYAIGIEFEALHLTSSPKPLWVKAFCEEIEKLKPKRLPMTDVHILDQFKKFFGFKKAIKYKTPVVGIKVCAQRGCLAMLASLARKVSGTRVYRHDEQGLSLLHHAAIHNRAHIIVRILLNPIDINIRRNNILASGPTAMHMAARCGSLDAVCCLWMGSANYLLADHDGWAPIHYAAYYDQPCVVRYMVRKSAELLELETKNELMSTPILLAASAGALSVVKCLVELSADVEARDTENNNLVILAALRFHTNVLQYLIEKDLPNVRVWEMLVEMLLDERVEKKDSAVKCLEVLSTSQPLYWAQIRNA